MSSCARGILVALITFIALIGTPGCASPTVADPASKTVAAARAINHALGSTEIRGAPRRIIALEFSFVDSLISLGIDPVGIADDNDASRVDQLAGKKLTYESVGTRSEPNQEIIAALAPDLILADLDRHSAVYEQLSHIAPTLVLNSREGSYEDIRQGVLTIAEALGDRDKGEDVLASHDRKMKRLADAIPNTEKRNFQLVVARDDSLRVHTNQSFGGEVLEKLGLVVAAQADSPYEDATLEQISSLNPDILMLATDAQSPITDRWRDNPVWESMASVRAGSVFMVDRNVFTRFRGLRSAESIAETVLDDVYHVRL